MKAVIFDMDGVLIDSEPLHFDAIQKVLREYDITIQAHELNRFVGDSNERVWNIFKEEYTLSQPVRHYISQQLQCTLECLNQGNYQPIDGVIALLQQLQHAKFKIGVASSSPPVIISTILRVIGIEKYIHKWVSGNEVAATKPAPYIYLRAAELLGCAPDNCIAIEDSYYGVTAAKAAGLACIGYQSPHATEQDLSAADVIVNTIGSISIDMIAGLK